MRVGGLDDFSNGYFSLPIRVGHWVELYPWLDLGICGQSSSKPGKSDPASCFNQGQEEFQ